MDRSIADKMGNLGMALAPGGEHEPYKDAIKVFENGHSLITAYKEKYGYSYRKAIAVVSAALFLQGFADMFNSMDGEE